MDDSKKNYITKLVVTILSNNDKARDEMILVVKCIHDFEMSILAIDKQDYYDAVFNHRLSSVKTIDRIWRKVQEENPSLRGANWELRQIQSGNISIEMAISNSQLKLFND